MALVVYKQSNISSSDGYCFTCIVLRVRLQIYISVEETWCLPMLVKEALLKPKDQRFNQDVVLELSDGLMFLHKKLYPLLSITVPIPEHHSNNLFPMDMNT